MIEDEGEIEYLDEDEDIVQHCIQAVQSTPIITKVETLLPRLRKRKTPAHLVERKRESRKRKVVDEDSDYDPSEDMKDIDPTDYLLDVENKKLKRPKRVRSEPQNWSKETNIPSQSYTRQNRSRGTDKTQIVPIQLSKPSENPRHITKNPEDEIKERKNLDIIIPNFEDPLCMPVRAIKRDNIDNNKLKSWNNLCLKFMRRGNTALEIVGNTVSSKRTIVLRNVKDTYDTRVDTTISSKIVVQNELGEQKSETYHSVLPRYREKTTVKPYSLVQGTRKPTKHVYEVILMKEMQKDEERLVVYKPKEALAAVYKMEGKTEIVQDEEKPNLDIKEVTCCKMCAPCYQTSWRGVRRTDDSNGSVKCAICDRSSVSIYNLLAHLKTHHTDDDVRKHKTTIAQTLCAIVDYHYKCRICQEQFPSIKTLRKHVFTHKGTELFRCDVGNHMAS